ncbi:MAG: hypothetical protein SAJ37_21130 [Oscillatoria sp. PMC 1068.18]|nr:hypothetical protein [Oscillatoria sp. PMC 1076.18]MEC4991246.1 hypothetical protein [Oscillatoria sp. PMC 1068.18]
MKVIKEQPKLLNNYRYSKSNQEIDWDYIASRKINKLERVISFEFAEKKQKKYQDSEQDKREELEKIFAQLVKQWREETRGVSSTTDLAMHPAYQQIIGMGKSVIPLLLRELEQKSGRWFWALKAITRKDPVLPAQRGRTKEMVKAWLDWGRRNGYTW